MNSTQARALASALRLEITRQRADGLREIDVDLLCQAGLAALEQSPTLSEVRPGDIVQMSESGALVIITGRTGWGYSGYAPHPEGLTHFRLSREAFELTDGRAVWTLHGDGSWRKSGDA